MPEYLFSISDNSETVNYGNSASKYGSDCVPATSVIKTQIYLTISAEASLSSLSTILPFENPTEEITTSRSLKTIIPVPKILKKLIILKKGQRSGEEIQSKDRYIESLNSSNTSGLHGPESHPPPLQKKIITRKQLKILIMKWCACWENYLHMAMEDYWIECVSCRNRLQEFCSAQMYRMR